MKRYYLLYYLLLIFWFVVLIFFYLNYNKLVSKQATQAQNLDERLYTDVGKFAVDIYNSLAPKVSDVNVKKDINHQFCAIFKNNVYKAKVNDNLIFNSSKSIWLYIFCKINNISIKTEVSSLVKKKDGLFIWSDISKANQIFSLLMNDLFNAKLASIFWFIKWKSIQESIKNFSDVYFGKGNDICWNDTFYLLNKFVIPQSLSDFKAVCSHPMTYNYLASQLKSLLYISSNIKLLNYDLLVQNFPQEFKPATSYTWTDITKFYAFLMNEYFWYSLYLNVYKYFLVSKWIWLADISYSSDIETSYNFVNEEVQKINMYLFVSKKTINQATRLLMNLHWSFPIHVALLSYFEDIIKFRKYLVQLYTPFHQLYYKLRNVEDLDR